MSVYKEKEQFPMKKPRDSSATRRLKKTESVDRRPITTQEKPATSKPSGASLKGKSETTINKLQKRKPDTYNDSKKDGKPSKQNVDLDKVKRYESMEFKIGKDAKVDAMYVKEVLDKKRIKKSETERSTKEKLKEKLTKNVHGIETVKRKEVGERKIKSRRDRTRTRTLSPTEIKQLLPSRGGYEMSRGDTNNVEVQSREQEKNIKEEEVRAEECDEEYEDDFEDYDSDFEKDDDPESTESPTNSSSLPQPVTSFESQPAEVHEAKDQWKLNIRKKELEEVKKSIEKENQNLQERRTSVTKAIEDDSDKENFSAERRMFGLVDSTSACGKEKKTRKAAASRKRGEELLNMISLDTISYNILEIPPISYDDFMKAFGKSNTKQVYVQTNEDDLDEEVQTNEIQLSNKWTQNPPEYLGSRKLGTEAIYILTREERLGVGGDVPVEEEVTIHTQVKTLWDFLPWASQLILSALERKSGNFLSLENLPNHSKAMAFGDGFVNLNVTDVPFLKGRAITTLCLLPKNVGRLLSVHINREKTFQKSMICIWSFRELSKPLKVLLASNRVTSCCFGLNQGNLVFAGLSDGSICLWDLRESAFHNRMTSSSEWSLQSPTYTTAGNFIDDGHSSPVVGVRLLNKVEESGESGDFTPTQICSLDKDGTVIIWTVVQLERTQRSAPSDDLGLAHWGRVKLVKSSSFSVFASLRDEIPGLYITCNDILINEAEDDGFYVANSLGSVHHCSSYGFPIKPKFYVPSKQDAVVEATCLELCPFNGNYFLVGCGDGTIRLHSRHQENSLICLNSNVTDNEKEAPVVSLCWMRMRPCVFFALDSMSRINIWDLGVSDMYPEISLTLTEKRITSMKLLSITDPRQVPFIVLGTEGGNIEIHKLKKEYGCRTASNVQNEMKMFLKYVSIL